MSKRDVQRELEGLVETLARLIASRLGEVECVIVVSLEGFVTRSANVTDARVLELCDAVAKNERKDLT